MLQVVNGGGTTQRLCLDVRWNEYLFARGRLRTFMAILAGVGRCAGNSEARGGKEGFQRGFHFFFALLTSCDRHRGYGSEFDCEFVDSDSYFNRIRRRW